MPARGGGGDWWGVVKDAPPVTRAGATWALADEETWSEDEHQARLFAWIDEHGESYPDLRMAYAIPNGGYRSKRTAARMKWTGTRKGYPDTGLDVARGGYHGLRVELKKLNGGRTTPEQRWWIAALIGQGYRAHVVKGWRAAARTYADYLGLPMDVWPDELTGGVVATGGGK
jgi:hypothetical protein